MILNCLFFYTRNLPSEIASLKPPCQYYKICPYSIEENFEKISELIVELRPICIFTFGEKESFNYDALHTAYHTIRHYNKISDYKPNDVIDYYMINLIRHKTENETDLISAFSTTYHSGDKILRPYNSLMSQTHTNWEWIVWDDSNDDNTYNRLLEFSKKDTRIRVYKAHRQNGWIGEMKEIAAKLARGKWITEIDHDDEFIPEMFTWIIQASKKYPDAGFIYSDCSEPHEKVKDSVYYGEMSAFGFGGYIKKLKNGFYQNVYQTQGPNPLTLQHSVGMPNHIRVWRKDIYHQVGAHNQYLPVIDDYDLYIRTFLATQTCRIPELCYLQYRNADGNFTGIRNGLIQHLNVLVYDAYRSQIDEHFKNVGIENYKGFRGRNSDFYFSTFDYPKLEYTFKPNDTDENPMLSIVVSVHQEKSENIFNLISSLFSQTYTNWEVYIIGNRCPVLDSTMEKVLKLFPHNLIEKHIRWYNTQKFEPSLTLGANYALKTCITTRWVTYLMPDSKIESTHLEEIVKEISQGQDFFIKDGLLVHKHDLVRESGCFAPYENIVEKWRNNSN